MRLIIILFILLGMGFIRMFWFEHYNVYLYQTYYNKARFDERLFWMFHSYSYNTLYYLKYVFTVFFVAVFYSISYFSFKWLGQKSGIIPLTYTYILVLGAAVALTCISWIENATLQKTIYSINLWLMGIAESPLPFLILWTSRNLKSKTNSSINNS